MRDRHFPAMLAYPFVFLGALIFGGFNLEEYSAESMLKKCRIPVLFFHGEADYFVPCEMSTKNYNACASEKTLLTFPDAGHGLGYVVDSVKYSNAVDKFMNHVLNN